MKKTLKFLGIGLVLAALVAISLPGSPVQLVSVNQVTPVPAMLAPTQAPAPTSAAPATQPATRTPTLTPQPTDTPVPTKAPNPYLDILQPLADEGKTWEQLDGQIAENTPVILVDLRKYDGVYTQALFHFTPSMQGFMDRDLGSNWNGANKGRTEYERMAFAYSDATLPTLLKVGVCKLAYEMYSDRMPITNVEVQMNLGVDLGVKAENGFVGLLELFTKFPEFDCDGHEWRFFQTPTPIPTATVTPTP